MIIGVTWRSRHSPPLLADQERGTCPTLGLAAPTSLARERGGSADTDAADGRTTVSALTASRADLRAVKGSASPLHHLYRGYRRRHRGKLQGERMTDHSSGRPAHPGPERRGY